MLQRQRPHSASPYPEPRVSEFGFGVNGRYPSGDTITFPPYCASPHFGESCRRRGPRSHARRSNGRNLRAVWGRFASTGAWTYDCISIVKIMVVDDWVGLDFL